MNWHALQITAGKERAAAAILDERSVSVFLPMKTVKVRRHRRIRIYREITICVIPGYLFFQTPISWGDVTGLRLAHEILADENGTPLIADARQMAEFIQKSSEASFISPAIRKWTPGDTARVTDGVFAGKGIKLAEIKGNRYTGFLIDLFSGPWNGVKINGKVKDLEDAVL